MKIRLFRGTGRFGPMPASAPPYVGRLHGVLAVLPSTRIASVAHAGLMQSFPRSFRPRTTNDRGGIMIYELRIYRACPGKLPALNARFSNHTLKIWERFGIRQVGFWTTAIGESNNDLYYILEW